jgi:hypothetical protein
MTGYATDPVTNILKFLFSFLVAFRVHYGSQVVGKVNTGSGKYRSRVEFTRGHFEGFSDPYPSGTGKYRLFVCLLACWLVSLFVCCLCVCLDNTFSRRRNRLAWGVRLNSIHLVLGGFSRPESLCPNCHGKHRYLPEHKSRYPVLCQP